MPVAIASALLKSHESRRSKPGVRVRFRSNGWFFYWVSRRSVAWSNRSIGTRFSEIMTTRSSAFSYGFGR